jgi:hypothetical protein
VRQSLLEINVQGFLAVLQFTKVHLTLENRVKNMKTQEKNEILPKLNLDRPPEGQECVRGECL